MSDKIEMKFTINVKGMIGGSFEVDRDVYEKLRERWEARGNCHEETDLADELLSLAPFDYFQHLNVDEMEIEDLSP